MQESIRPLHYKLELTPDLGRFRFNGQVTVDLDFEEPVDRIELNSRELAVWCCRLKAADGWQICSFHIDPEKETLTVFLPASRNEHCRLQIEYEGNINDQMTGFYRSRYQKGEETCYIAVTQFQESSARQAFPCLDHPRYKATFDVCITAPADLAVIANTPMAEEHPLANGTRRVIFEQTPVMSTYLVFFAVGEFEFFQNDIDKRIRVAALPGLQHTTALGLTFGRQALQFCEKYYGIAYPLAKMDLIAIPDFAFGAMENWGAIAFRENLLLHFPDTTSAEGIERICEVIAHEIAHQWFGNLVTPADWKYLWLNESFATYFGFGVVAHVHPDWDIWDQFLHTQTATAMARDGLQATFPIEIPGGGNIAINSSTAPIIYNKGASMLRMIEGYIGPQSYQQGIRTYLTRNAYDCAESHHLWEAFEDASSLPITAMVKSWVSQPGYPLVTASRTGASLALKQHRFTYLPHETEQSWMIPLTIQSWGASGDHNTQITIFQGSEMVVGLPENTVAYKVNSGQTGFYRVFYDDEDNLAALGDLIQNSGLGHTDRWGLQNDIFALMRACRLPLKKYIDFVDNYRNETRYLPLISTTAHLHQAYCIVAPAQRERVAQSGRVLAKGVLRRIGTAPREDEPHTRAALRNQLLWQALLWGDNTALAFCGDQFERMALGHPVHPDIAGSIMKAGAHLTGRTALDWFKNRFTQSPSEHERMNILAAMGAFQEWELVEEAFRFTIENVPPRNQFVPIVAAAGNTAAAPFLWKWYQQNLTQLEAFHPLLYERVITGIVPSGGLEHMPEVYSFFEEYRSTHPQLKDAIDLALENLTINARMRRGKTVGV